VTGTTTLEAGTTNNITLDRANNFNIVRVKSGNDVTLNDNNAIGLGASDIQGNLTITANGTITQNGDIGVTGTTTLEAGTTNNITLDGTNNFNIVRVISGNDVTLNEKNAIRLGASDIQGNLTITANGTITQNGDIGVTGTTTLEAGTTNNITLDRANNFNIVRVISGNDVTLNDNNAIGLGASDIQGNLTITANGTITQNGNIGVTGTTTLEAGTTNNITLDGTNNFNIVRVISGKDVTLNDNNAIGLGASDIQGNLTITANGTITQNGDIGVAGTTTLEAGTTNNITLDRANNFNIVRVISGNDVTLNDNNAIRLGASDIQGILNVTAKGAITQSGNLSVGGAASFITTLANAGNVSLTNSNPDGTVLETFLIGGDFTLNSTGNVSQMGDVKVAGNATIDTQANVTLDNPGNVLRSLILTNGDVVINQVGSIDLPAQTGIRNLTVNSLASGEQFTGRYSGNAITLNQSGNSFRGSVSLKTEAPSLTTITGTPGITQSGAVTVTGNTTLNATNNGNITLNAANNFNRLAVTNGNNVTLNDTNGINLGSSTISGSLNLTTNGDITQSGNLRITGSTILDAGAANDITLDRANNFSHVAVTNGNNVTLNDTNALNLGTSTISGNLDVTAKGSITQSGNLSVAGSTTLDAGATNNITLNNNNNNFNTVSVTNGNNVTLNDTNAIELGTFTVSGNLDVTANGSLSTSGEINAGSVALIGSGGITLNGNITTSDTPSNTVAFTGPVTVATAITINTNNSTNSGNITFNDTLNGPGDLTLDAGRGDIAFKGIVGISPLGNLLINSAHDVTAAAAITADSITQVAGSGTTTFNGALNTNSPIGIDLNGNEFVFTNPVSTTNNGNVTIANSGNLSILAAATMNLDGAFSQTGAGAVSTAGNIITTNDNISFNGPVTLTGTVSLNTDVGAGNISFNSTVEGAQNLTLTAGTGNIDLKEAVGGSTPLGSLTINSARDVQAAAMKAASITQVAGSGTTTFNGVLDTNGAGGIDLNGNDFVFSNPVTTTNNGNVTITNSGNLSIPAAATMNLDGAFSQTGPGNVSTAGNIITTNDNISFNGRVAQTGNVTLQAGTGTIAFNSSWAAGDKPLTLMAAEMDFFGGANSVTGTNTLDLKPATLTQPIAIAGPEGTPDLDISQRDINALGGFKPIIIGQDNGSNPVTINAATFDTPVKIQSPRGNIDVVGSITGLGPASITIDGANLNLGNTPTPNITITTQGQDITLGKNVVLYATDVFLTSRGGNITFQGNVNGSEADTDKQGQGLTLSPGSGQANFKGEVGNDKRLRSLTIGDPDSTVIIGGENATLAGSNTEVFKEVIVNALQTKLSGTITTLDGNITFNGNVTLTDDTFLNTGPLGAGNISFNGTLDSELNEYNDLRMIAGTGDIIFRNTVGAGVGRELGAILIENAKDVRAASTIEAASLRQLAGSGKTTLQGSITTTERPGVNINANLGITTGNITANSGGINLSSNSGEINTRTGTLDSKLGAVNLIGTNGITTGNITANSGGISLSSNNGAINTRTGTLDSKLGAVNLIGTNGITTSNITANSGGISLSSNNGAINTSTGTLDSKLGAVNLIGTNGITTGNITAKRGEINLRSNLGAINTSTGRLNSSGRAVNLTANQGITTSNITSQGGRISLTSDLGAINTSTGRLNSSSGTGTGGEIRLINKGGTVTSGSLTSQGATAGGSVIVSAASSITSGGINSSSRTGKSGAIALTSQTGTVQSGNLTSTGQIGSASVTVSAKDNITTANIDSSSGNGTGGVIALTSQAGAIQNGNLTSTGKTGGGSVNLSSQLNITAGNIDSSSGTGTGGAIALTSQAGALQSGNLTSIGQTGGGAVTLASQLTITAGNIDSSGGTGTGGAIALTSQAGAIQSGNLTSTSGNGTGGAIALTSQTGAITSGNLTSSGAVSGGSINVLTLGNVTLEQLNSSSSGIGGSVILNNAQAEFKRGSPFIQVVSINTQGGALGTGGNVEITTDGLFRATGTFLDPAGILASISTAGGPTGGSIKILHGGGTVFDPFEIGAATNNGTAGAITNGTGLAGALLPIQTLKGPVRQANIEIIPRDPGASGLPFAHLNPFVQVSNSLPPVDIDTLTDLEQSLNSEFGAYLGQTASPTNPADARKILDGIEQQTGIKSAFIYATFVPEQLTENQSDQTKQDSDRLELLLVTGQGQTIRKRVPGTTRALVVEEVKKLRSEITNPSKLRTTSYLAPSQQLYKWVIASIQADLEAQKIQNLVFIMDAGLRSLPVATLHDGQGFLVEKYSVGVMPSLSLTDTSYADIKRSSVLAMGLSQANALAKSLNLKPLPAVPIELQTIVGMRQGKSFLNEQFTLDNLKSKRNGAQILHLATHGEFKPGPIENSYMLLWDNQLRLNQLRQLNWNNRRSPVELLVLSACRTAVGDEKAELGFAGFAVQAGVKSALASLWYVSDEATFGLMTEFYRQLQTSPIKAEALRKAQLAMLKREVRLENGKMQNSGGDIPLPPSLANLGDKNLSHPYFWSAFTMIGSPW
jgi:CHAT domain-containing protein